MDYTKTIKNYINKTNYYLDSVFKVLSAVVLACLFFMIIGLLLGSLFELINIILFHFNLLVITFLIVVWSLLYYTFNFKDRDIKDRQVEKTDFKIFKFRNILSILIISLIVLAYNYNDFFRFYNDGIYCAEVDVSGNNNYKTYSLKVEVEEGNIAVIYWNNGGWLDDTHFDVYEADVDGDGLAMFTDDRGRDFYVKLKKRGSCQ